MWQVTQSTGMCFIVSAHVSSHTNTLHTVFLSLCLCGKSHNHLAYCVPLSLPMWHVTQSPCILCSCLCLCGKSHNHLAYCIPVCVYVASHTITLHDVFLSMFMWQVTHAPCILCSSVSAYVASHTITLHTVFLCLCICGKSHNHLTYCVCQSLPMLCGQLYYPAYMIYTVNLVYLTEF